MSAYIVAEGVIRRFMTDLGLHYLDPHFANLAKAVIDSVDLWRASQPVQGLIGDVKDPDLQEPTAP